MATRKMGCVIDTFEANENVVDRCIEEIKKVYPSSLTNRLLHVTIKAGAYAKFVMDGFTYTTDEYGNFSSLAFASYTTPEIYDLRFLESTEKEIVVCFVF